MDAVSTTDNSLKKLSEKILQKEGVEQRSRRRGRGKREEQRER
jgi:hypothetical protein